MKKHKQVTNLFILCLSCILLSSCAIKDDKEDSNIYNSNKQENSSYTIEDTIDLGYVYFGSYPQKEIVSKLEDSGVYGKSWQAEDDCIINETIYTSLNDLDNDKWDEYGDTTIDNVKYRRIKQSDATSYTVNDDSYYCWSDENSYHYFKYEPIKWRILKQNENSLFLLSDICIDDQKYNTIITNLTWETSTIRSWLNGYDSSYNLYGTDYSTNNFIDIAFTESEKSQIINSSIINSDSIKHGTEGGNDTSDCLFLLSEDELYGSTATQYGFDEDYNAKDEARQSKSSTYAKAMGLCNSIEEESIGNCDWWMRSPGSYTGLYDLVYSNGKVYRGGQHANSKTRGVRPAMYLSYTKGE